jgi:hypothetical protein
MALSNQPGTTAAGIVRVPEGGTAAGGPPQISTAPSGRGWVVWGIESSGTGNNLYAHAIVLPALRRNAHDHGAAGKLTLTGPASCMPVTTMPVGLRTKPARGWVVTAKKLELDGHAFGGKLAGGSLKPSSSHTLTGKVTLRNGGRHARLGAKLTFKTCGRP